MIFHAGSIYKGRFLLIHHSGPIHNLQASFPFKCRRATATAPRFSAAMGMIEPRVACGNQVHGPQKQPISTDVCFCRSFIFRASSFYMFFMALFGNSAFLLLHCESAESEALSPHINTPRGCLVASTFPRNQHFFGVTHPKSQLDGLLITRDLGSACIMVVLFVLAAMAPIFLFQGQLIGWELLQSLDESAVR